MHFAELDLSGVFTEKFLVAVGATTGSLSALAIIASFWLVKRVVEGGAHTAAIALVRRFMALCTGALGLSVASTISLAVNNRDKVTVAETAAVASSRLAAAATAEKRSLVADVAGLREKIARTDADNARYAEVLKAVSREPMLAGAARTRIEQEVRAVTPVPSEFKATTQLDQLLRKHEAPVK